MNEEIIESVPFELDEIEDVRIILKVKGKHYSVISAGNKEEGRIYRIELAKILLSMEDQIIVIPALEDIKIKL